MIIQTEFDFQSKEYSDGLLLQCPVASCRKSFRFPKERIYFTKGVPFARCPLCHITFEIKANGKNEYHTLLEGDL
jgi:hypothetical protein